MFLIYFNINDFSIQPYLNKLFTCLRNYLHPSNAGHHTQNILTFILFISIEVAARLQRERHNPKRHPITVNTHLLIIQLINNLCLL
jgi:hypothetical protein